MLRSQDPIWDGFEGVVPVRVKHQDLDERHAQLTIRFSVEAEKSRGNHKVLRCRLTEEGDPFLLFTLDIDEEDFTQLKQDQRLLVDFTAFPSKLVELLEKTRDEAALPQPKFIATLKSTDTGGTLCVVETNKFRQLVHISLQVRAGTDSEIKRYLASRVKAFKAQTLQLTQVLEETKERLRLATHEAENSSCEARKLREEQQRAISDVEHRSNMALAQERERALECQRQLQARLESDQREKLQSNESEINCVRTQLTKAQHEAKTLVNDKYRLEAKVQELQVKLQSAQAHGQETQDLLGIAREQNRKLDAETHTATKTINGDNVRIATIEQQLRDKDMLLDKMTALLEAANAQKGQLQDTVALLKSTVDKYDQKVKTSIGEIHKGNGYIEQLSSELQAAKAKIKLKAAIVRQQEQLLNEKETAANKQAHDISTLRSELAAQSAETQKLQAELDTKNGKLEESHQLLQSNQQVITWLNKEVNEAQLGRRGTGSSAVSGAFKPVPSAMPPSMLTPPRLDSVRSAATTNTPPAYVPTATTSQENTREVRLPRVEYKPKATAGASANDLLNQLGKNSLRESSAVAPFVSP